MTSLYLWLLDATRGLSAESAAQVRAEIQQHYDLAHEDSACEAGGGDDADVMRALGDPGAANRAYRKVLLTETEARMVPSVVQPKRLPLPAMLLMTALSAAFFLWRGFASTHPDPGFWPVRIAVVCDVPLIWFFPLNTLKRTRIYLYLHGLRNMLLIVVAWWYDGWIDGLALGAVCFLLDYLLNRQRLSIFRKLGLRT